MPVFSGNSHSLLFDDFLKLNIRADVAFCINVLHSLSNELIDQVLGALGSGLKIGGTLVLHDMSIMPKGEPDFLSWDADMATDMISNWCIELGGRNFETRGGLPIWSVCGRKKIDFEPSDTVFSNSLLARKSRLALQMKATMDPLTKAKLNEYYFQLDQRLG